MYKQMIEKMPSTQDANSKKNKEESKDKSVTNEIITQPKKKKYVPYIFPSFKPKSEFWNFTKQNIYVDNGIQTQVRWKAYLYFVENGLIPMIQDFGYYIQAKPIQIVHNLCIMSYAFSKNQFKSVHFTKDPDAKEDDLEYFEFQIDDDIWNSFWKQWSDIYDFSNDCDFGPKIRYNMPYFIWSFVNIQLSSATTQLDEELSENENDHVEVEAPKPKQENVTDDNYYSSQSKFYN